MASSRRMAPSLGQERSQGTMEWGSLEELRTTLSTMDLVIRGTMLVIITSLSTTGKVMRITMLEILTRKQTEMLRIKASHLIAGAYPGKVTEAARWTRWSLAVTERTNWERVKKRHANDLIDPLSNTY